MTQDEIIASWNKQADYMNKWNYLGEDEKLEWAMKLEREACAKVCETLWNTPTNGMATEEEAYGDECAAAIRARGQA